MRAAVRRGRTAAAGAHARSFHFGSSAYAECFLPAVEVDPGPIRSAAVQAVAAQRSRPRQWFDEPVTSLLRGSALTGGTRTETIDAFGRANGAQLLASEAEMQAIIEHAQRFVGAPRDLRSAVRRAEATVLRDHGGALVANQLLDFGKQDGVTEIEEAHQANAVEHRLNDLMWQSEQVGQLHIPRRVVLVPCVSNFSHCLDMCRKVCRNLERGVPVIVLSRSHTAQYPFRWAELLQAQLQVTRRPGEGN
jgi:cob(I)alamin adenosyltransferase